MSGEASWRTRWVGGLAGSPPLPSHRSVDSTPGARGKNWKELPSHKMAESVLKTHGPGAPEVPSLPCSEYLITSDNKPSLSGIHLCTSTAVK